jgi:undecaprenyl-diphosphatase
MTIFQSIVLGIVQGLTEFIPVSSSAHLVLVPYWLGWTFPADQVFVFDVLVQLGTLLAVIIYFRADLTRIILAAVRGILSKKPFEDPDARLGWLVVLATIPAGFAGLFLKKLVESAFHSPMITAILLLGTGALLILAELLGKQKITLKNISWMDALIIGIFQAISIFPGISRSGSTITGGLLRKLDRTSAARFSFLMSIPIMIAAGAVATKDLVAVPNFVSFLPMVAAGFISAAIVGFLSIKWLLRFLRTHSLFGFAIYCVGVWLVTFIVHLYRG